MSKAYLVSVLRRAAGLIEEIRERLPEEQFQLMGQFFPATSTKVLIQVRVWDPEDHRECDEELSRVVDALNQEFRRERSFRGIEFEVPRHWAAATNENVEIVKRGTAIRVKRSEHG